ncbi:amino acid ABC transporter ATP-binding protein [Azospirillum sp. YIM B02556]|uniref:Amino acid ABC transporter ATP-binding protein n=2 Tax=Azospirillum endophyticum TaxID=2800326 RepID=A0ABS1FAV2_9PROT|nr:amino acid ABC transporter ATP-binding protein [Azospirillum endophyticum]
MGPALPIPTPTPAPQGAGTRLRTRAAIELRDLRKRYGEQEVLRGVTLTVERGEKIVLCGPSGSGKSTLIRCINGLERHDGGTIAVNGVTLEADGRGVQDVRREVGMVFQHFNLFPHMTVLENCTFAPRQALGLSAAAAAERAMHHLARVRIADQAGKFPAQLSGGQQQRVAIARALCMDPRIMLFDEPTSALDPEMVAEVLQVMEELAAQGMTMLCVTHEMGFARHVADRCVFLDGGEIVEQAGAERFFVAPESDRLKRFLRQMLH